MRGRITVAVLAIAVASCAQVRKVGKDGRDETPQSGESRQTASPAPNRGTGPNRGKSGQPAREGKPPLPATPSGLVNDSAARQLKEELHRRGYLEAPSRGPDLDAATSDALRRFQQHEGLAATGFPDQETLHRLNVDVSQAYRAAPEETNR